MGRPLLGRAVPATSRSGSHSGAGGLSRPTKPAQTVSPTELEAFIDTPGAQSVIPSAEESVELIRLAVQFVVVPVIQAKCPLERNRGAD